MGKWFMQVMKIIDRKLALLGRIMRVYRQMEGTIADLEPRRLAELIYEGNKVAMELEALLQEERAWLERFSRERSKKFMSLKAVASCLKEDEQRQRLLSGCAGIDRLATGRPVQPEPGGCPAGNGFVEPAMQRFFPTGLSGQSRLSVERGHESCRGGFPGEWPEPSGLIPVTKASTENRRL